MNAHRHFDTIIIGGGQSGLATAYHLRRYTSNYLILDNQPQPGGAWQHGWDSLRLFSPAEASSLPGWLMPSAQEGFPTRLEVITYLTQYEKRYNLPVLRPVQVETVEHHEDMFVLHTNQGEYRTRTLICATGNWSNPYWPYYPGQELFSGTQLHSAQYRSPDEFRGKKVLIVGAGNSAAQILAEVSRVATTQWVTLDEPNFLPDEVDGRQLFQAATARYNAAQQDGSAPPPGGLETIVMVPSVKEARERDVLHARRPFISLLPDGVVWPDGTPETIDAIIWCTGFRPALHFLRPLGVVEEDGKVATEGTRASRQPGLWLVGYGGWTGFASATLIGVNRSARQTAGEVNEYLQKQAAPTTD
ncbi:ArsO family NAD(P)H-dependent flavin-containing monooxygenase [Nibrella saemangeumensis]|uniref:ArsO family NAD(P)H-dependent flavin-containing monooxygenase n=1 Tax=Nibrella saemangeumensis TaxID=1084526 RepID=A0ABP8MBK8_9BACT